MCRKEIAQPYQAEFKQGEEMTTAFKIDKGVPTPMIYGYAKRKDVSLEDAILHFMWRDV